MWNKAELFAMAQEQPKEVFKNNVTLSVPDNAPGCVDLDAETERLSRFWDVAHMTVRELAESAGLSQSAFARAACIPLRTMQNWCGSQRNCPDYIRFLLAEHFGLI